MTIQFKIANLDRDTADGFVTTAHWAVTKPSYDGNPKNNAYSYGSVGFTKEDGVNLIPYEDLTEEIVIEWVKNSIGAIGLGALETSLNAQINEKMYPSKATGTPW